MKFKVLNSYVPAIVKVISAQEVKEVKSGLRKQDYIVGDSTGAATVTLWEYNIGALKVGASYKLSGMMVREFDGKKLLSMPKQDGEITSISDIGAVMKEECAVADGHYMKDAVIIGVLLLDTYSSCCICKSKVQVMSATRGQRNKCNMVQQLNEQTPAKLVVQTEGVANTLTTFTPTLQETCQGSVVTVEALVLPIIFRVEYVITNISRANCNTVQ